MIERHITTTTLRIAYRQFGDDGGWPCILGHGFPYDVHAYTVAAELLAASGARVIVPYLRGYARQLFSRRQRPAPVNRQPSPPTCLR